MKEKKLLYASMFPLDYDWEKIRLALKNRRVQDKITGTMQAEEIGMPQSLYSMFMSPNEEKRRERVGTQTLLKILAYLGEPHEEFVKETKANDMEVLRKFEQLLKGADDLPPEKKGMLDMLKANIEALTKGD